MAFLSEIHAKHVELYLHQQGMDTTTPAGKALFQMMGVFAEFERTMIQERVKAGLERAKAQGKRLGRPTMSRFVAVSGAGAGVAVSRRRGTAPRSRRVAPGAAFGRGGWGEAMARGSGGRGGKSGPLRGAGPGAGGQPLRPTSPTARQLLHQRVSAQVRKSSIAWAADRCALELTYYLKSITSEGAG